MKVSKNQITEVSENVTKFKIKSSSIIAMKVTGNKPLVTLDFSKAEGFVKGICVFASGNQPIVKAKLGLSLGKLVYIGRGNNSQGEFEVLRQGAIGSMLIDLNGNNSKLTILGDGAYSAKDAIIRGKTTGLTINK